MSGASNSNNDEEVVIANDYFVLNGDIDQQEELDIYGGGISGVISPPVAQTEMVNDTKGLNISWGNCRGGIILMTQTYFSFPSMKFPNILAMWFCGDTSKIITTYRAMR